MSINTTNTGEVHTNVQKKCAKHGHVQKQCDKLRRPKPRDQSQHTQAEEVLPNRGGARTHDADRRPENTPTTGNTPQTSRARHSHQIQRDASATQQHVCQSPRRQPPANSPQRPHPRSRSPIGEVITWVTVTDSQEVNGGGGQLSHTPVLGRFKRSQANHG